ncbi:glucose-1-phosphate adenylyltransferase [Acetobacterium tundrae]|uniref:Glucose-1-phosphate adenylyltransferase n=1 Tax=Acetobacterium tundrae TaxID=132932 RepID=A0ABR6WNM6_9FIRM|nr:glucose-1-phosphate adenylyltransferase [Acetobacterium tundrae]MBC3798105.1 glucose-1-phosphate adenylyltransferase [Acetobacterium tundrae]
MNTECVAMLLAGGQGSRLGDLTINNAKPAVLFGGKYRIIDFPLSNCMNSDIDVVGVLTQYRPYILNNYIGDGSAWALDQIQGGAHILPPYMGQKGGKWYSGTADAIYQNIDFIENFNPEFVLVLSGDHIYKMDYSKMLCFHKAKQADLSIAVMDVPWEDAHRFGIVNTDEEERIQAFQEKPAIPKSNKASMGIYVFSWEILKKALQEDAGNRESEHDFGNDVIPMLYKSNKRIYAYPYSGYWRDVGTIQSYFDANMDLLDPYCEFDLTDRNFRIFSNNISRHPQFIGPEAKISNSLICDGCIICGQVEHSILSHDIRIHRHTILKNVIVHTGAIIEDGAILENCILGGRAKIKSDVRFIADELESVPQIHVINS